MIHDLFNPTFLNISREFAEKQYMKMNLQSLVQLLSALSLFDFWNTDLNSFLFGKK